MILHLERKISKTYVNKQSLFRFYCLNQEICLHNITGVHKFPPTILGAFPRFRFSLDMKAPAPS